MLHSYQLLIPDVCDPSCVSASWKIQSQTGGHWGPSEAHHNPVSVQMHAEMQLVFHLVELGCSASPGELEALTHSSRGASQLRPAVSASKQRISLLKSRLWPCHRGWLLKSSGTDLCVVRGDLILMCSSELGFILMFMKVLFFYPEILCWLLSKVEGSAVESFLIKWCFWHQARDSAFAFSEADVRGSSSCLPGWRCTPLSPCSCICQQWCQSWGKSCCFASLCSFQK